MSDARAFAEQRRYSAATLERWQALGTTDARALLDLANELRPSENQLRDLWDWAEDVAHRDGLSLAQVLALEPVAVPRRSRNLGRNDRLRLIKGALRRLRFPQLTAAEERLAALVRAMDLPRNVRITFPEFLEGDEVTIEIVARDLDALRTAADHLKAAIETPACKDLFELLEEAP